MDYINQPCPGCGSHMHEDDDIVVCPVCATPQHRSCWKENNKCVNEHLHAEGYVWSAENKNENINPTVDFGKKSNDAVICHVCGEKNPSGVKNCMFCDALLNDGQSANETCICPICGSENPAGASVCGRCGNPINSYERTTKRCPNCGSECHSNAVICVNCGVAFGPAYQAGNAAQLLGISENETIEGIKAADIALYVKANVLKFLNIFRNMERNNKRTFNWAAFFLGPVWFFYRRIYGAGIVMASMLATASLFVSSTSGKISEILSPYYEAYANGTLSNDTALMLSQQMFEVIKIPLLITLALTLAVNFMFGLSANRIYLNKIKKDITTINEQVPDENMRVMFISRRGGKSIFGAISGYFIYDIMQSVLMSIAEFFRK